MPEEEGLPWARWRAALKRYKWLILTTTLVGLGLGIGLTRLLTPQYEAWATIWIASQTPAGQDRGPIRHAELLNESAWSELVKSFTVLDPVVAKQQLYLTYRPADSVLFRSFAPSAKLVSGRYELAVDPAAGRFRLTNKAGAVVDSGLVGGPVGTRVGFEWTPDPAALRARGTVEFAVARPREVSLRLQRRLQTVLAQESNFLKLSLIGTDPARTAATLNALAEQFVVTATELKRRSVVEFSRVLNTQLQLAERQLRDAEVRLENFRVNTIVLPSEGTPVAAGLEVTRDPVFQNYFSQKVEYDNVRRDREVLEGVVAGVSAGAPVDASSITVPPTLAGAEELRAALATLGTEQAQLRAARQFYTDEHQTVQNLERSVARMRTQEIPTLARELISRLRRREADLGQRIGEASRELRQIPTRTIEEMRLRREVAVSENLYTTLQERYESARLAEASTVPDVSLLDAASVPQFPTSNTTPRIIFVALVFSLGVGCGLALLLDRSDRRFRYPEQATKELGLEVLGAIPLIRHDATARDPEAAAQVVESFRSIRLNLLGGRDTPTPFSLTVSSPGPGDGKSLVSSNLALSFAEAGYRTLLIDGDIRRGELHKTFEVERRPGLVDYLAGGAAVADTIRPVATHENLDLLPSGTRRHRGPELLSSGRLPELIGDVRSRYDVVIVDSPPFSAGIDPYALAVATGNLVCVLRTGVTDRKLAAAKLRLMDRLPVAVLGAILNDIRTAGSYEYYAYSYGYSAADEDEIPRGRPPAGLVTKGA
ncbi:MAG TPA: polysaccharide biosynthesis tyrosine autokinase [Gemmatimonadaceae bacterium]|nr:polysaccharide biosynthesis tyrosine autokinase [Gemmatimonadaceae bacterium]